MEHQKILKWLSERNDPKFVTRKRNIVDDNSKSNYDATNEITYNTEVLKSNLCDYNNASILVRGDITVVTATATQVAFKNCAPLFKCLTKIDETTAYDADDLDLVMPMYNLIEYSSNYSEATGSLWFYSKDEASNFNNNIANTDNFKSFKYKAKFLGNTEAQADNGANGIRKYATIAVLLEYLRNFWRSLEMPSINCKIEWKIRWPKHCVLSVAGTDGNHDDNDIIFPIEGTKLYVPVVTLLATKNQKLSKLLSKGFERSVYWDECKTKSEKKNTTNEYSYFLESNFVVSNKLFILVYSNEANNAKKFNDRKYYLPKGIIKSYNVIINGKNVHDQPIDSDIKRYEEIGKLRTGQGEDYTNGYFFDYHFIKNHYRLIVVDLSSQKELNADPKAIQQTEFVRQLKWNRSQW